MLGECFSSIEEAEVSFRCGRVGTTLSVPGAPTAADMMGCEVGGGREGGIHSSYSSDKREADEGEGGRETERKRGGARRGGGDGG